VKAPDSLRRRGEVARPPLNNDDPPPPLLGSWRNLYLLVAGALLLDIALFALFTRAFR
jgi:hypothetical protein